MVIPYPYLISVRTIRFCWPYFCSCYHKGDEIYEAHIARYRHALPLYRFSDAGLFLRPIGRKPFRLLVRTVAANVALRKRHFRPLRLIQPLRH